MRIAHVTDCFLPRVGGIERQVDGLSSHQAARGDDVQIVTTVGGPAGPRPGGLPRLLRPVVAGGTSTRIRYADSRGVARAFDPSAFDVVHVHVSTVSPLAYLVAARARTSPTPVVVTVHSMWTGPIRPVLRTIGSATGWARWPVTWSAVSSAAARHVVRYVGPQVTVLPNGVDPTFWSVPHEAGPAQQLRIASVMRLTSRKNPLGLVSVLRALRRELPPRVEVSVRIVGDGPQRRAVAERLRAWGMDGWVHLEGQQSSSGIREVFAASDVYVAPARQEAFGIAALEARSAGLPVVGFARSGIADIVTSGRDGLLVDDDQGMTDALRRLALDPSLVGALRQGAAEGPVRFDWDSVLARCDAVYDHARRSVQARSRLS